MGIFSISSIPQIYYLSYLSIAFLLSVKIRLQRWVGGLIFRAGSWITIYGAVPYSTVQCLLDGDHHKVFKFNPVML